MPEPRPSQRPAAVPLTDEEWQQLPHRVREAFRALCLQQEQLRKQLAESQLDGNLKALFDEHPPAPLAGAPIATGKKVLVADDSALIRKLVRTLTDRSGCQLLEAEDGAEALRLVQENEIDLMILDINMPKVNGLQVLQALRAHGRFRDLPVVMLTTSNDRHDVAQAIAGKVQAYLLKDNRDELGSKLLQLLQAP